MTSKISRTFPWILGTLLIALLVPLPICASETVLYSEDFEASNGGYTESTDNVARWAWATPSGAGASSCNTGLKCWGTDPIGGVLPIGSWGYIVSPAINIPAVVPGQVVRLRYHAFADFGVPYSRGQVLVSNNMVDWTELSTLLEDMSSVHYSGGWHRYELDITALASPVAPTTLYVMFLAAEADGVSAAGLYVDDIAVTLYDSAPGISRKVILEAKEEHGETPNGPLTLKLEEEQGPDSNPRVAKSSVLPVKEGKVQRGGTFYVYTWDEQVGSWINRDGGSFASAGETRTFDLTPFLMPDYYDGTSYEVLIWQNYAASSAGVNYAGLQVAGSNAGMTGAYDISDPYYAYDIKSYVEASDTTWYEYEYVSGGFRNRWIDIFWTATYTNTPPMVDSVWLEGNDIHWIYSDYEGNPQVMAEVEVWTGPNGTGRVLWDPPEFSGPGTAVPYGGPTLAAGVVYYVRVKTFDGNSWGAWTECPHLYTTYYCKGDVNGDGIWDELDYHLIGIPGVYLPVGQDDPLYVFTGQYSYTPSIQRILWYDNLYDKDPLTGEYLEYPMTPWVMPGYGFWFITVPDRTITAGGTAVPEDCEYYLTVYPGWNMLAHPFLSSTPWSQVLVFDGEIYYPLDDPGNVWVQQVAYGYDMGYFPVETGAYAPLITGSQSNLEPWNGYWVYNYSNMEVALAIFPTGALPPEEPAYAPPAKRLVKARPKDEPRPKGISFSLSEARRKYADRTLLLGLDPRASAGPDFLDALAPPPVSANVPRIYVDHRKWETRKGKYARDFRPTGKFPARFPLVMEVPARQEATTYVLRWEGIEGLSAKRKVMLKDPAVGRRVDMRTKNAYRVTVPAGETRHKLVVTIR